MGFILLFIMSITPSRQRDVSAVTADTTEYSTSENSGKKIPPELQLPEGSENATCSTSTPVGAEVGVSTELRGTTQTEEKEGRQRGRYLIIFQDAETATSVARPVRGI
ncbi:hypothetical protein FOZ63_032546 [Perkinsus olseni]|uniref:Uncharacterized protein n=1 Tax=Perkinsus olseni TaxID=32597 RepID=A0A7J6TSL7_PEROL|nr:hypothetical protein FOZ63_032546 [Perkinsus olseni]